MEKEIELYRILAVERYKSGESPETIYASLGKSRTWLYKWIRRYSEHDDSWNRSQSRCPHSIHCRTPSEIEEIVKIIRLNLYNQGLFYGAQAIRWELEDLDTQPMPSIRTINRILSRNGLTHRRTGKYEAKRQNTAKALAASATKLRFPGDVEPLRYRQKKPTTGKYHLVRLIRRNEQINIFGELFRVPPELVYEYVVYYRCQRSKTTTLSG